MVLSGSRDAVARAIAIAPDHGARRCIELPVSAPFHCALMAPAAEVMAEALAETEIRAPSVPLVSNVTAEAVTSPDEIRKLLVAQVTGLVRWRESILYMRDHGVGFVVELGAGKVLTGLTRRIDRDLDALAIQSPDDMAALLAAL